MPERESCAFAGSPEVSPGTGSGSLREGVGRCVQLHARGQQQVGCGLHAGAAVGAAAGAHGQLRQAPATRGHGLADVAIGDSIAETDIHGGGDGRGAPGRRTSSSAQMRMSVNTDQDPTPAAAGAGAEPGGLDVQTGAGGTANAPAASRATGARCRRARA